MKKRRGILLVVLALLSVNVFCQIFEVGDKLPDIVLNSPDGEEIKLSSLEGKMVLVDFWASWCAPCRKEHPLIVETYHKYKDAEFKNGEGFTVFSISLDKNETIWKKTIEKDELEWPYHVSDLKGWKSDAAIAYGIKSIPMSYLIDGDGVVVAVNPRGDALEAKLKKMKKKSYSIFSKDRTE